MIQRLHTVAEWLVEEGYVLRIQGPEREWKERLADDYRMLAGADPEAHRPRYTLEEMRALLVASRTCDPRFTLLLALGAELRLGQVVRARRRDLDVAAGTFTVRGRGKKRGTLVKLTTGQRQAVVDALAGYLSMLEETGEDYPLFPAGQMTGGRKGTPMAHPDRHLTAPAIGRRWVLDELRECERKAGVPYLEGRGSYGIRRIAVDEALEEGISESALQAHGGWTDPQTPRMIYRNHERSLGADEAARIRARVRGEFQVGTSDA